MSTEQNSASHAQAPRPAQEAERAFVLDRTSAVILDLLARYGVALRQDQMASILELSRPTLRPSLNRLLDAGMIVRPYGDRSGYVVSQLGIARLVALPTTIRKVWGLPD